MATLNNAQCRSCGAAIIWVKTEKGRNMPLDAKPERRMVQNRGDFNWRVADTYQSHFSTCPHASEHRRRHE